MVILKNSRRNILARRVFKKFVKHCGVYVFYTFVHMFTILKCHPRVNYRILLEGSPLESSDWILEDTKWQPEMSPFGKFRNLESVILVTMYIIIGPVSCQSLQSSCSVLPPNIWRNPWFISLQMKTRFAC